jgi:hypothetical protein
MGRKVNRIAYYLDPQKTNFSWPSSEHYPRFIRVIRVIRVIRFIKITRVIRFIKNIRVIRVIIEV